jgi:tetratricopeptide (TPR) repeat protein
MIAVGLLSGVVVGRAEDDGFFEPSPLVQAVGTFELGEVERAESLVLPLTEGAAATADACSLLGQIRLQQKRPAEAVEQFARAVAKNPASGQLRSRLGEALLAQAASAEGERRASLLQRARAELERAEAADTGCLDAQMGLLRFHLMAPAAGIAGAAERHAAAAAQLDPLSATYEIAALAESFQRFDLAEPYYRECARQFPNPWLSWKHGCMLARLGRPAEARAVFEAVLRETPGFGLAQQALAALPAQ